MEALRDYQILNNFLKGITWNDVLFNFMLKIVLIWFFVMLITLQMAACPKRALLIGPNYSPSLPTFCGPLEGVQNDLELMEGMLQRNGFQPQDIKVIGIFLLQGLSALMH